MDHGVKNVERLPARKLPAEAQTLADRGRLASRFCLSSASFASSAVGVGLNAKECQ
jgi:hypothetical protein